jgi:hypothetical protein
MGSTQAEQESIKQGSRALNLRLTEQTRLNSSAIKAKLKGELSPEDFESLKAEITEENKKIEDASKRLNAGDKRFPHGSDSTSVGGIAAYAVTARFLWNA